MIIQKHLAVNNMQLKPFPFRGELAMEAYIVENEDVLSLEKAKFEQVVIVGNQIEIANAGAKKSKDGRIDIVAQYGEDYLAIVELKKDCINEEEHLQQLISYLRQRQEVFKKLEVEPRDYNSWKWIGILVGTSIKSELAALIDKGEGIDVSDAIDAGTNTTYMNDRIPLAALTINRFSGVDGTTFIVTDTYFASSLTSSKDTTQYRLGTAGPYGKGRVVLAAVTQYVKNHPGCTYAELSAEFKRSLQGKYGVIAQLDQIDPAHIRRYFIKDHEQIQLDDGSVVVVSNQWGVRNIGGFIDAYNKKSCGEITAIRNPDHMNS